MSYGKIYTLPFYDVVGNAAVVDIYKESYAGAVSTLRCTKVEKSTNYAGKYQPIITSFLDVEIINQGLFTQFDDMFESYERQYKAIATYKGTVIFEGYLNCEDMEQTFSAFSTIRLTFNDALQALKDTELTLLNNLTTYSLLDYIQSSLDLTGWGYDIHINSRIFYAPYQDETATDTLFEQTGLDTALFYKNDTEKDSVYDLLSKILLPFDAFIYIHEQKFIIERYKDIGDNTSGWVVFTIDGSEGTGTAASNLYASLNKQSDFNYKDLSQRITYSKAVNTLKVSLQDEAYVSKVYNDAQTPLTEFAGTYPTAADLAMNDWTIHEDLTAVITASDYKGISRYISYLAVPTVDDNKGVYYKFAFTFNEIGDTVLKLEWKVLANKNIISAAYDQAKFYTRFFIRVGEESVYTDWYLHIRDDAGYEGEASYRNVLTIWEEGVDVENIENDVITYSTTIDITDLGIANHRQDYIIGFLPTGYRIASETGDIEGNDLIIVDLQVLGDFKISINKEERENDMEYTLNENFIKKEQVDLHVFTSPNLNLKNGVSYYAGGYVGGTYMDWVRMMPGSSDTGWGANFLSLEDSFVESVYQRLAKNIKQLRADIIIDQHLKPLTILTDNNLEQDSATLIRFLILSIKWNIANCVHTIMTEEYVDETINIIE